MRCIVSVILGLRYLRLSKPWFTVLTFGMINWELFLKLYRSACLKGKRPFQLAGEIPRCALYISIARLHRFLWCIETVLSLSKRFSKDDLIFVLIYWAKASFIYSIYFIIFCAIVTQSNQKTEIVNYRDWNLSGFTIISFERN